MKWRPRFRLLHLFGLTLLVAASLGWLEYVKRDRAAFVEMQSLGCYFRAGRDQHFDEIYHPHLDRFNPPPWSDAWDDSESDVVHGRSWGRWLSERCRPPSWNAGTLVVERGNPLSIAAKHAERLGALKSVKVVWVGLTADDLDRLSELPGYRSLQ
ncbi:MAG TPA: hypothetical protein VGE52_06495, partial [Pirellulales bacterium]